VTFESSASLAVSERFMLVQITAKKHLGPFDPLGGDIYTSHPDLDNITNVYVNGRTIPESDWSYVNGLLTVETSADDLTDPDEYYTVVDFEVYLTGTKQRSTADGVAGLPSAIWQPYIVSYPQWSQTVRNITEGVLTLSGTEIQAISPDRYFQELMGDDFSWYQAPVSVWVCIDDLEINRLVFSGEIAYIDIKNNIVTFSIIDSFQNLNQTAMFGSKEEAVALMEAPTLVQYNPTM